MEAILENRIRTDENILEEMATPEQLQKYLKHSPRQSADFENQVFCPMAFGVMAYLEIAPTYIKIPNMVFPDLTKTMDEIIQDYHEKAQTPDLYVRKERDVPLTKSDGKTKSQEERKGETAPVENKSQPGDPSPAIHITNFNQNERDKAQYDAQGRVYMESTDLEIIQLFEGYVDHQERTFCSLRKYKEMLKIKPQVDLSCRGVGLLIAGLRKMKTHQLAMRKKIAEHYLKEFNTALSKTLNLKAAEKLKMVTSEECLAFLYPLMMECLEQEEYLVCHELVRIQKIAANLKRMAQPKSPDRITYLGWILRSNTEWRTKLEELVIPAEQHASDIFAWMLKKLSKIFTLFDLELSKDMTGWLQAHGYEKPESKRAKRRKAKKASQEATASLQSEALMSYPATSETEEEAEDLISDTIARTAWIISAEEENRLAEIARKKEETTLISEEDEAEGEVQPTLPTLPTLPTNDNNTKPNQTDQKTQNKTRWKNKKNGQNRVNPALRVEILKTTSFQGVSHKGTPHIVKTADTLSIQAQREISKFFQEKRFIAVGSKGQYGLKTYKVLGSKIVIAKHSGGRSAYIYDDKNMTSHHFHTLKGGGQGVTRQLLKGIRSSLRSKRFTKEKEK